ncbi:AtpZ/AtpI family protein [Rhodomicrobium sp. Az07]|uniref:AtpZ/AtpI family protein n=1 Tax=Rhodomicrobium sp. Az07 TaxID=2839034 RepID=UPI001BE722CB|nr:AtpZ/AtpI family protein [Rhodomicrobium sp. Az07]MBT3071792.1 AtpZ/AtpI family protein [Rhodomicrobium sp. Az07]
MNPSGDGDPGKRKGLPETSESLRERLRELERKLDPEGNKREGMSDEELEKRSSMLGRAFKISTEMVAGVFVGGFIGWVLDQWLDTRFFVVVFLFLGIAAGFLNVIREARRMGGK